MKKSLLLGVALAALMGLPANAADLLRRPPPVAAPPVWNWTGFYGGLHTGAAFGEAKFSDPYGTAIFGDFVETPAALFGGQLGYNAQLGPWVYGVEIDASALSSDGTNTCFAVSGLFLSSTCRVRPDFLGTLTGRLGYAVGPDGRTLIYGKAGGALMHEKINIARNFSELFVTGTEVATSATRAGWTAGLGVEQAIAPAWSWRFEYDYQRFSPTSVGTPATVTLDPVFGFFVLPVAANVTSVRQDFHTLKVGVNYKFGVDPWATWNVPAAAPSFPVKAAPAPIPWAPGWEFEAGGRYWFSFGRFQKNVGLFKTTPGPVDTNISRLTYDNMKTRNGEFFARIDSPYKVFVKGFIGGGKVASGNMHDEDWFVFPDINPASPFFFGLYSNTNSSTVLGHTSYGVIDVGFTWLRGPTYKSGVFIGYTAFKEKMNAYGCVETAGNLTCIPSVPNTGGAIITENDRWRSLRLGSGGEISLGALRLSADAAYLPNVKFRGEDNHFFGNTGVLAEIFPESGKGHGVQFEAMLNYDVTPNFTVGVGGRYWAMWTTSGAINCTFGAFGLCGATPTPLQNAKYSTEQAGLLMQASYKFGAPTAPYAGP